VSLIASVQATPGANGGSTGPTNMTGAKLFAMHIASFAAASGVSDSKNNTWIPKTLRSSVGGGRNSQWFILPNPVTDPAQTFAVAGTGIYAVIQVLAYDDDVDFDAESGAGSNGPVATIQPGSITPAGNNGLFITGVCANLGSLPSIDSGFTLRLSTANGAANNMEAGVADKQQTTGGAESPTWQLWDSNNIGSTDDCACSMLVFKPATPPPPAGWGQRLAGERNRRVRGL
jgi:hypothetical protein